MVDLIFNENWSMTVAGNKEFGSLGPFKSQISHSTNMNWFSIAIRTPWNKRVIGAILDQNQRLSGPDKSSDLSTGLDPDSIQHEATVEKRCKWWQYNTWLQPENWGLCVLIATCSRGDRSWLSRAGLKPVIKKDIFYHYKSYWIFLYHTETKNVYLWICRLFLTN